MHAIIISFVVLVHFVSLCSSQSAVNNSCITSYQELKSSLRSNRTHNVQRMLDVFYPPNTAPSHVVFVTYCVRNDYMLDFDDESFIEENCDEQFQFQWLTNTIPLLIDSDVFKANTFNFVDLLQMNLTLMIDPFCNDIDAVTMLETLSVWLKSYAQGEEDNIKSYSISISEQNDSGQDEGYLGLFEINGTSVKFIESRLVVSGKKFVIGLWLGITSLTFALVLHIGRISAKTANAMNKVLLDLTEFIDKIIGLPQQAVQFMHKGVSNNKNEHKDILQNTIAEEVTINNEENGGKQCNQTSLQNDNEMTNMPTMEKKIPSTSSETVAIVFDPEEENTSITITNENTDIPETLNDDPDMPENISDNSDMPETISDNSDMPTTLNDTLKSTDTMVRSVQIKRLKKRNKLDHAFQHFAKSIQKLSTISTILLAGFLFYDIYIYLTKARKLSFDWLILFPFPFWFITVTIINLIMFVITEIIVFRRKKEGHIMIPKQIICYEIIRDFFVTMSTTTTPLFVFFHLFWLGIALTAFSVRLLSSATFYLPLAIFGLWLMSAINGILKQWKKLIILKRRKREGKRWRKVLRLIGQFLYPMTSLLFLPFWLLLLATLHFFSDFLLVIVNLESQSFLVIGGVIIVITIITHKIAMRCQSQLDDDDYDIESLGEQ